VSRIQHLFIRMITLKLSPKLPPQGVRRTLTAARDILLNQSGFKSVIIFFDVDP